MKINIVFNTKRLKNIWRYARYHKDWHLVKREFRLIWQELTRGWASDDTWSLDATISRFILPRLKLFKQVTIAYPMDLTVDEWDKLLDDMIYFHECVATWEENIDEERYNRGRKAFGDYYNDLWW